MKNKILLLLLVLAVFIPFAFSNWGLTESSEARYAEISREMYTGGDYLHPKLLGIQHFHKPPVTYYITAAGYAIFGVNEYGARFFLQIALLMQVMLVFLIAQRLYQNRNLSIAAALIYFSYPVVQIAAKNLTTDAYLTTFIFSCIYFFIKYQQTNRKVIYLYLFYIFCGLAFLTKGPVGLLPQVLFAVCYMRMMKIRVRLGIQQVAGILLCILISASWFAALLMENKSFLDYFLHYQIVNRVSGDVFHRSQPFWYYFMVMPPQALPAFIYFIGWCISAAKKRGLSVEGSNLLLIPLVIMFIIFSASSSKLILYVMPLYLFIAILSARYLTAISLKTIRGFNIFSVVFAAIVFAALATSRFFIKDYSVPAIIIPLCIAALITVLFIYQRTFSSGFVKAPLLSAVTVAWLICMMPFLMKANETAINSVKPVATYINEQDIKKEATITVYNYLLPSLAFYTGRKILTVNNGYHLAERETFFEKNNEEMSYGYIKLATHDTSLSKGLPAAPVSYLVAFADEPIPDSLSYLKKGSNKKIIGDKWAIYH